LSDNPSIAGNRGQKGGVIEGPIVMIGRLPPKLMVFPLKVISENNDTFLPILIPASPTTA
jgi:hypothetical protein